MRHTTQPHAAASHRPAARRLVSTLLWRHRRRRSAGAQDSVRRGGCVDVVAVDGLIDEIEADFIVATRTGGQRTE